MDTTETSVDVRTISRAERRRLIERQGPDGIWLPVSIILGAVVVVHAPVLFGWLDPNPIHIVGGADRSGTPGLLPGLPFIDPNIGITSQALGHRAILDWLHGQVPWWNPYEGVGSPLAGGFQAAAFFPPTLLTLFTNGQLFLHMILESTAGIATFFLLRTLCLPRWIATLGGVLFALNGTFSWMGHAPANPVAFLPMLLLGIEHAFRSSEESRKGGWFLIPVAIALSLVAGFPETAYIDGLLAAFWTVARIIQSSPQRRRAFIAKLVEGGVIGLLLAAPLLVAVYEYLPNVDIGLHAHIVDDVLTRAATPLLVMPYSLGPIDAFVPYDSTGTIANIWGGGYLTTSLLFLALISLVGSRHRGLRIALAAWVTFALMRTMGVGIAFEVTKAVPFLDRTLFSAYSAPSWEMATLLLAVLGLDDLVSSRVPKLWILLAGVVSVTLTGLAVLVARSVLKDIVMAPGHVLAAHLSALWAFLVIIALMIGAFGTLRSWRFVVPMMAAVLFLDVAGAFVVPELSNPRNGQLDSSLIAFLQKHLGTNRFYTFGPISPNYGSYFGIASINVNDVPIPKAWAHYVSQDLDTNTFPLEFTGYVRLQPGGPTPAQEFRKHIDNYAWVGVKYVVTTSATDITALAPRGRLRPVYDDGSFEILQLTKTAPFFQATQADCTIRWSSWNEAAVRCTRPTTIVRRELSMSGWTVTVNGSQAPIGTYHGLFETVKVPAGTTDISFHYAPRHADLAVAAFFLGFLALCAGMYVTRRGSWVPQRKKRPLKRRPYT